MTSLWMPTCAPIIVLELKKDADVNKIKAILYKKTKLEDTYGVNMLAIDEGRPETMNLKQILNTFLEFQYRNMTKKYNVLLEKELEKKEVQEGLIEACDVIDLIIAVLRGSKNMKDAKECLMTGNTEKIRFRVPPGGKHALNGSLRVLQRCFKCLGGMSVF